MLKKYGQVVLQQACFCFLHAWWVEQMQQQVLSQLAQQMLLQLAQQVPLHLAQQHICD